MSDLAVSAQAPRVRVNATEAAKGGFRIEVTVECFQGENAAALLAQKIKEVRAALTAEGLQTTDAA